MAKENTHIYFADSLLRKAQILHLPDLLQEYRFAFFLGNVLPDAWYYGQDTTLERLAAIMHGEGGLSLDLLVQDCIAFIKKQGNKADLAVLCGWLAHMALDGVLHPVIDRVSGNFDDPDPTKRRQARYRHRLLESAVDKELQHDFLLQDVLKGRELEGLALKSFLCDLAGESEERLHAALVRQIRFNRLFTTWWAYSIARFLVRLGRQDLYPVLPMFYAHLRIDQVALKAPLLLCPPESPAGSVRTLTDLMDTAGGKAARLMRKTVDMFAPGTDRRSFVPVSDILEIPV